jgi:hypothetical protein
MINANFSFKQVQKRRIHVRPALTPHSLSAGDAVGAAGNCLVPKCGAVRLRRQTASVQSEIHTYTYLDNAENIVRG